MEKFKVTSNTNPAKLAGAIAKTIQERGEVIEIGAIGAGAVNQTVKAAAIARGYLVPCGTDIVLVPSFKNININGEERTSIVLEVKKHEEKA